MLHHAASAQENSMLAREFIPAAEAQLKHLTACAAGVLVPHMAVACIGIYKWREFGFGKYIECEVGHCETTINPIVVGIAEADIGMQAIEGNEAIVGKHLECRAAAW